MRLVTFNILHGRSLERDAVDLPTFAAAIAELDADVLALQEVDHFQTRSQSADLTAVAAEAMGAVEHRFVAALSGSPGATWTAATGAEQPDSAAYGISLLTRYAASSWQVVRLPRQPVIAPMRFHNGKVGLVNDEPRVAVAATLDSPLGPLMVATTHLTFVPWWNGWQLRQLVRALRDDTPSSPPLLLTGDLNMEPGRARRISGLAPLGTAPTFPADAPARQLDHVLLDRPLPGAPQIEVTTRRLPVSDHLAYVVDVTGATSLPL